MIAKFKTIPNPLRRQILLRLLWCTPGFGMLVTALYTQRSWHLAVPGLVLILFSVTTASLLYFHCARGRYVAFTGECVGIDRTPIRRAIRSIRIRTDEREVLLMNPDQTAAQAQVGDILTVYVASSAPVYDQDSDCVVFQTLAVCRD